MSRELCRLLGTFAWMRVPTENGGTWDWGGGDRQLPSSPTPPLKEAQTHQNNSWSAILQVTPRQFSQDFVPSGPSLSVQWCRPRLQWPISICSKTRTVRQIMINMYWKQAGQLNSRCGMIAVLIHPNYLVKPWRVNTNTDRTKTNKHKQRTTYHFLRLLSLCCLVEVYSRGRWQGGELKGRRRKKLTHTLCRAGWEGGRGVAQVIKDHAACAADLLCAILRRRTYRT